MDFYSLGDNLLGHRLSHDERFAYNVLTCVFKYLDVEDLVKCTKVCHMWSWIALEARQWRTDTVNCCKKHLKEACLKYGHRIHNFALLDSRLIEESVLAPSLALLRNVNTIKFYGCHETQLHHLKHRNLHSLVVEIRWGASPTSLDFVSTLENLTHLDISTSFDVTGLEAFKYLKKLKHLAFTAPTKRQNWKYIVHLEKLETLKLTGNRGISWDRELFDERFCLRQLKNLYKLHISELAFLHEHNVLCRIKDLPNLKELVLENVSISRAGMSNFSLKLARCKYLEKLEISISRVIFYNNILDVALENSEVVKGVSGLRYTLKEFIWRMDSSGMMKVKEFYGVSNATVLKVKWSHLDNSDHNIRYPWAIEDDIAPVTVNKLIYILKKRLRSAKVKIILGTRGTFLPLCCFCKPLPVCPKPRGTEYKCISRCTCTDYS
ncbi:uncharacterized protein LOC143203551 [Rhynchophorus ferrugineus]|uniref:uncharacterized protein LOC143203551 n=1 Tax=Rhynchophorus ferrugineus TaxID=354439 RepID=UPI003FCE376E